MKAIKVRAVTIGNHFAVRGALLVSGETLWTGPLRPYSHDDRALTDAHAEAARRGWAVSR
ncbi:hypothetical protein A4G26_25445 [Mycobacterium kansasii]|uniref:Uncharacterized protein n=1 Tax=Mycobacterium innocens TaxID=2341083 RepID=A0A498PWA8_9MYCO|nr:MULTISPECIES: hypothetical protein [Mycobacterium]KZS70657.1 hypothetical protein A4G26_25445 [Mycobacterium kansasii]VBA38036.1 hypothetical protein LAUMK13_01927 [Mycobacterium innocens]